MNNCTCQKMRRTSKNPCMEVLSSVEKNMRANMRNYLSSVSPRGGGVDHLSLVACIAFHPTLLKAPAHTWWLAQTFHNP